MLALNVRFLARVFGTPLAPVDPSKEDYKRKLHLAAEIVEGNDVHVMYKYVDPWWNLWLRLVSLLAIVMVSCCASGMYHNVLHKTPLEGTAFDAPYSKVTGYKGQLPYQSLWIAAMISIASLALIALGRVATLNYAFLKVPMFFVCAIAWMSAGGFLLHLFTDKNRWYISGTFLHGYIMQLLQKS
ncbi:hypothetical protein DIPPA_01772 [Diplonema papillatum]|nr:hypothetical protein DIPPA_01772 [Diplonema papillatum]